MPSRDVDGARRADAIAHEALRDAIRRAALTKCDKNIADFLAEGDHEAIERRTEIRKELEAGVLVDYAVVTVFDAGQDHTVSPILRTDGSCAQYRTVGLLHQALRDVESGA